MSDGESRGERLALIAAALVCATSFLWFAWRALPLLTFPYEVRYGESVVHDQARRVFEEPGLYPPVGEAPWVVDNYPPVYPFLMALVPTPSSAPLFGGRLISILAAIGAAWLIAFVVRREAGDSSGLLAAAVFLALPPVQVFGPIARVDLLGVALGLAGFLGFLSRSRGARVAGAVAFLLSVYTRHSLLVLPIAGSMLLVAREGRRALVWPLSLLAAGIACFVAGNLWWEGRLWEHLIRYNVLEYHGEWIWQKWLGRMSIWDLALLVAALLAFAGRGERIGLGNGGRGLIFLLGSASALLIGRVGSDRNYLSEFYVGLVLVAGSALGSGSQWRRAACAALLGVSLAGNLSLPEQQPPGHPDRLAQIRTVGDGLLAQLRPVTGRVLCEVPWVGLMLGQPLEYEAFMLGQLARADLWDPEPLVAAIREQEYGAIVRYGWTPSDGVRPLGWLSSADRSFPQQLVEAVEEWYEPSLVPPVIHVLTPYRWDVYNVWFPRP